MTIKQGDRLQDVDLWWLLVWLAIATILRLTNLGAKPASSIEIATLGFSLGHGFNHIPLDSVVSMTTLLSPLKLDNQIGAIDVIRRLFAESTHPPLYFWLTHWWVKLFTENGELVTLTAGRSLSAILGSLTIPAIFSLSWLSFRSRLAAHVTAILMAVSPYGIYLAQEARHYTISILWIVASLSCMTIAINRIQDRKQLPWAIALIWIVTNSLGMATHYFFALTLLLEGSILLWWWWRDRFGKVKLWLPIVIVGLGTLVGCLVWLPVASGISDNSLTEWIETDYDLKDIWLPLPRILGWLITMVGLLPIEGVPTVISVSSIVILLLGLIWTIPLLVRGGKILLRGVDSQSMATVWLAYCLGGIGLALGMIYGYGRDISLAARYHFSYFPGVILFLGATLATLWQNTKLNRVKGKQVAITIILIGFLGSLTVVNNLGFQKSRQANRLAAHILTTSQTPGMVATTYETHAELREAIALALALETNSLSQSNPIAVPQFLLLQRNPESGNKLASILATQPKPLYIWGVNLRTSADFMSQLNCSQDDGAKLADSGYKLRVYVCR